EIPRPGLEVDFLVEVDRVLPLIGTSPAPFPRLLDPPTDLVIRGALLPRFPPRDLHRPRDGCQGARRRPHEATARLLAESRGTLDHQGGGERPRKNVNMALHEARHGTSGRYFHRRQGSMLLGSFRGPLSCNVRGLPALAWG